MMTHKERVEAAIEMDNSISVKFEDLKASQGHTISYLESLGLLKSDLKKLERQGRAVRGYGQVPKGGIYRGAETTVRWVLLADHVTIS